MSSSPVGNALRGVPSAANRCSTPLHGMPQRAFPTALVGLAALLATPLSAAETDALKPAAIQTEDVPPIPAETVARLLSDTLGV